MSSQANDVPAPGAAAAVPTVAPAAAAVPLAAFAAEPPAVQEARAVVARFRRNMKRLGGIFGLGLVAGTLSIEPITWTTSAVGLGLVSLAYRFPLRARVRRARAALLSWEGMQALGGSVAGATLTPAGPTDPRLAAADAVIARIGQHGGADPRAASFAQEVREQLGRVLEDARAVELLRRAAASPESEAQVAALRAQVDEKIGRLMGALADVYQAVLAHDDSALEAVLRRGEDALRQLRARNEVEKLLQP